MTTEVPQNLPPAPAGAPDDLWTWSLRIYARDGFAPAALRLQDRAGLDVNLLLWCLWAGVVRRTDVGAAGVAAAAAAAGRWQAEVVRPLRAVRRALKGYPHPDPALAAALRERVAAEELAAERGEQALLAAVALDGRAADPAVAAARNLVHYSRWTGLDPGATADADLALLLVTATGAPAVALLAAARADLSPA
jgi:uncharacterized protein (TIGR02444 family)